LVNDGPPEYEKAAEMLKEKAPGVSLAKVDASKEIDLAKEQLVEGFPTLTLYRKGVRDGIHQIVIRT
jgi:hypothetical protein